VETGKVRKVEFELVKSSAGFALVRVESLGGTQIGFCGALPAANGVYLRGLVVSNRAKAFKRKDGMGTSVAVECEIALQPGVATWVRYFEPTTDTSVHVEGENVVEFPKLKEFQQVTIHATKVKSDEHTGQLMIRAGVLVV
jgi:hypothetical protein